MNMTNTRGIQNGIRQAFIYRGVQVMPTLDGGWLAAIGGRLYSEAAEDNICFEIDATHVMLEAYQQREAQPAKAASVAHKQAISGGAACSPSHTPRRYSTSSKRGAA